MNDKTKRVFQAEWYSCCERPLGLSRFGVSPCARIQQPLRLLSPWAAARPRALLLAGERISLSLSTPLAAARSSSSTPVRTRKAIPHPWLNECWESNPTRRLTCLNTTSLRSGRATATSTRSGTSSRGRISSSWALRFTGRTCPAISKPSSITCRSTATWKAATSM